MESMTAMAGRVLMVTAGVLLVAAGLLGFAPGTRAGEAASTADGARAEDEDKEAEAATGAKPAATVRPTPSGTPRPGATPTTSPTPGELQRAVLRKRYNDVYQASLDLPPEQALESFRKLQDELEKQDSRSEEIARCLFNRAFYLTELRRYPEAMGLNDALFTRFPTHQYADDALYRNGLIAQNKLQDLEKAITYYEKLLEKYPASAVAPAGQLNAGDAALSSRGDVSQANVFYDNANRLEQSRRVSSNITDRPVTGNSSLQNQVSQRQQLVEQKQEPDVQHVPLRLYVRGLAALADRERLTEAEKLFREILKRHPQSKVAADATFQLAETLRRRGKLDEAFTTYENFVKKFPASSLQARAWNRIGDFRQLRDDLEGAREAWQKARDLSSGKATPATAVQIENDRRHADYNLRQAEGEAGGDDPPAPGE